MVSRRDALRLAALAVLGPSLLAECAEERKRQDGPVTTTEDDIQLVTSDAGRTAGDPDAIPAVVAGLHDLTGGLFDALGTKAGNLAISPYSIAVALGMTLAGARGRTAEEMRAVLGADDRFHAGMNALTAYVDGLAGEHESGDGSTVEVALDTANQVFGQRDTAWEQEFLDLLAEEYGAALRAVDYKDAADRARLLINAWVEERTHDRIEDLVPPGVLDRLTRLVLVNAIYLKAPWAKPFEKSLTAPGRFHAPDGDVRADLMRAPTLQGAFGGGQGWGAARIPYVGGRLAMTVVLPDEGRFAEVERQLATSGLGRVLAAPRPAVVDLRLPRWRFTADAALRDVLAGMGMPTAFDPNRADFSGMTTEEELSIAQVLHKAFIAVDEDGTEAAAATAVLMETTSAPAAPVPFHVDRPFLFVIHDVRHLVPLFVGRVLDPTAS